MWSSSRSRNNLRHRQHLAELDARTARNLGYQSKVAQQRTAAKERLQGLLELKRMREEREAAKPNP